MHIIKHITNYSSYQSLHIEVDIVDFTEIDTLIENNRSLIKKPDGFIYLIMSATFFLCLCLLFYLLLVIFNLK